MVLTRASVSAPGVRGCVYVLKDFQLKLDSEGLNIIEDIADITLCSQQEYARYLRAVYNTILNSGHLRFGTSFAVVDMNGDNVSDLVVGHPYSGAEELQYQGGVSVFLGNITADQFSLSSSPSFTVRCSDHPCSLGGGRSIKHTYFPLIKIFLKKLLS